MTKISGSKTLITSCRAAKNFFTEGVNVVFWIRKKCRFIYISYYSVKLQINLSEDCAYISPSPLLQVLADTTRKQSIIFFIYFFYVFPFVLTTKCNVQCALCNIIKVDWEIESQYFFPRKNKVWKKNCLIFINA